MVDAHIGKAVAVDISDRGDLLDLMVKRGSERARGTLVGARVEVDDPHLVGSPFDVRLGDIADAVPVDVAEVDGVRERGVAERVAHGPTAVDVRRRTPPAHQDGQGFTLLLTFTADGDEDVFAAI